MKGLIAAGLFIGSFSLLSAQAGPPGSPRATIREISGVVELKAPNQKSWSKASPGDYLERETLISTGFRSSAVITMGDATVFVRPLTRLSLGDLSAGAGEERIDLHLRGGRIRVEARPPAGGNFTVRSPIATASVRGTVFDFDGLNLRVSEGTVYLAPAEAGGLPPRALPVSEGESSFVDTLTGLAARPGALEAANLVPPAVAGASRGPAETPRAVSRASPGGSLIITVDITEKEQ
jgi:hypothetical protein